MPTQRITFQTIKNLATSTGFCSACGKRTVRQRTFEATVNPYNRNADGSVKSATQVRADVLAKARAWQGSHDHENCPEIRAERVKRKLARK